MRAMPDRKPHRKPPRCDAEAVLCEIVDESPVKDPLGTLPNSDPWMLGARSEQQRQKKRARSALEGVADDG